MRLSNIDNHTQTCIHLYILCLRPYVPVSVPKIRSKFETQVT